MKIHELPGDPGRKQPRKRIGRGEGSGHGKTAGKGNKGHQARSGGTQKGPQFEGGQMPITRRLPKFGFTNIFRTEYEGVNVTELDAVFADGEVVDRAALEAHRLVRTNNPVKILGNGEIKVRLEVHADAFSKSAIEKIEAAGGKAVKIEKKVAPVAEK